MPSRRKRCLSEGRVDFKGLRFFLEKTGNRLPQKELVELIRDFFDSKGLKFWTLRVEFCRDRQPSSLIDGKKRLVWGLMHPRRDRVQVFLNVAKSPMNWKDVIETLFHELDHVAWELEGKEFDDSLPYRQRPHEVRARESGAKWLRITKSRTTSK